MLVGGMVGYEIEDHLQSVRVRGVQKSLKVTHRTKQRVYADVVRNIVAEIGHRRGEDWRQPNGVNTECLQIGQAVYDPSDVTDAIRVGILERARVDLIKNAVLPPGFDARSHLRLVLTIR